MPKKQTKEKKKKTAAAAAALKRMAADGLSFVLLTSTKLTSNKDESYLQTLPNFDDQINLSFFCSSLTRRVHVQTNAYDFIWTLARKQ